LEAAGTALPKAVAPLFGSAFIYEAEQDGLTEAEEMTLPHRQTFALARLSKLRTTARYTHFRDDLRSPSQVSSDFGVIFTTEGKRKIAS
jgi:hypothetical protein